LLAIEAISLHKQYEEKLGLLRNTLGNKKQIPIDFLDIVYMFERITQSWADVADLVQPIYNK
ncbi:MAG: phosphate uptake regulator PhoU, partial [Nitrosopumilus sp.]|nr:phosphate uptake regulator PhoU [Nitrosopumilus sp.]